MLFMISKIFNPETIITNSVNTLKRFPLAMLSAFIATAISIYFIQEHIYTKRGIDLVLFKLQYLFIVATFAFSAVELVKNRLSKTLYFAILALIVVGLYGFYLTFPNFSAHWFVPTFRAFFLSILFFISILWTPWLFEKSDNYEYWKYAKSVIVSFLFTIFFTIVAILGVNGALFAIEKLFGIHIKGNTFASIDIFIIGVFGVGYFLSQLPLKPTKTLANYTVAKTEIFFTKYILTPLTIVYFLILYAYTFKIVASQVWPKSILSWLIIVFSIVAITTYLFWTHIGDKKSSLLRRLIWLTIGLQTIMLFIAVGFRINAYSWTENRYMVVVFGIWLLFNSIYFLIYKSAKLKVIFISLSLLVAITQIGPLNVYTVSKNAQSKRLNNLILNLKLTPKKANTPEKLQREVYNTLSYLCDHYNIEPVKQVLPDIVAKYKIDSIETDTLKISYNHNTNKYCIYTFKQFVANELGLDYEARRKYRYKNYEYKVKDGNQFANVKGYNYAIFIETYSFRSLFEYKDINTSIKIKNSKLKVNYEGKVFLFEIDKLIATLKKKYKKTTNIIDKKEMTIKETIGNSTITLIVNKIYVSMYQDKKTYRLKATLLIK